MPSLITLGLVETLFDPVMDKVKRKLFGATTIKRAKVDDQLVVFNEDMLDAAVRPDVNIGVGVGVRVGVAVGFGGQSVGSTSCSRCSDFLCEKCKKHDEDSIMYLQTLRQAMNEFKNKRGVKVIPSKNVRDPYTPHAKRRKNSFIKTIQKLKKKIFGELAMAVGEKLLELKKVNLYKHVPIAQKSRLLELMRVKDLRVQYDMHYFSGNDFRTMTSVIFGGKIGLMREWHLRYPEYYHSTDRIMDLNFYTNFKKRYDSISEEATTVGGRSFTQLINEFVIRPYPGGMDWIGAKMILAVMNMNNAHFVTLEIILHEGRMNVYDCNLMGTEHTKFLTFIQHVFELLPSLLKQSGIMKHLPDKFLNEQWEFDSRLELMVKNKTKVACGSYPVAFIEHLITNTIIQPPETLLCDNTVGRMQWN